MAEELKIIVSVDDKTKQGLNAVQTNIEAQRKRLQEPIALKYIDNLSQLQQKLVSLRSQLSNKDLTTPKKIEIRANIEKISNELKIARRELNNFVGTGNKEISLLGTLFGGVGASIKRAFTGLGGILATTLGLNALKNSLQSASNAAMDFESAFAGVKKTVDATPEEFKTLEAGIKKLSTQIPKSAAELSRVGELGGQLGIPTKDLLGFIEVISRVADTTNLTLEGASTDFARFANITQLPVEKLQNVASAVVDLGNNFATTEQEIVNFAMRIAGAGEIAGLTEAQTLGIATAFSSVGIEAESGGTAVQKALLSINEATIKGGENLLGFASVAGMTSAQFKQLWEKDAGQAFALFVNGLTKSGDGAGEILEKLIASDVRLQRAFLSLAGAGDLVNRAIDKGTQSFEANNALAIESGKRYETNASQIQVLKDRWNLLSIEIGNFLNKYLIPLYTKFTDITEELIKGEGVIGQYKGAIIGVGVAIGGLLGALGVGGLVVALGSVISAMGLATTVAGGLAVALGAIPIAIAIGVSIGGVGQVIYEVNRLNEAIGVAKKSQEDALDTSDKAYKKEIENQKKLSDTRVDLLKTLEKEQALGDKKNKDTIKGLGNEIQKTDQLINRSKKLADIKYLETEAVKESNKANKPVGALENIFGNINNEIERNAASMKEKDLRTTIRLKTEELQLADKNNIALQEQRNKTKEILSLKEKDVKGVTGGFKKTLEELKLKEDGISPILPSGGGGKSKDQKEKEALDKKVKALEDYAKIEMQSIVDSEENENEKARKIIEINEKLSEDIKKIKGDEVALYKKNADEIIKQYDKQRSEAKKSFNDISKDFKSSAKDIVKYNDDLQTVEDKFTELGKEASKSIREISNEIQDLSTETNKINDEATLDLGLRRVEVLEQQKDLEKEIKDLQTQSSSEEDYTKRQEIEADILSKQTELNKLKTEQALIEGNITTEQIKSAELEANKSKAQKILDAQNEKLAKIEEEKKLLEEKQAINEAILAGETIDIESITDFKNQEYARDLLNKQTALETEKALIQKKLEDEIKDYTAQAEEKKRIDIAYAQAFKENVVDKIDLEFARLIQKASQISRSLAEGSSVINNNNNNSNTVFNNTISNNVDATSLLRNITSTVN